MPVETFDEMAHAVAKEKKYDVLKTERKLDIVRVPKLSDVWEELFARMKDPDFKEYKSSWDKDYQRWRDHVEKSLGKMKMDIITHHDIKRITDKMARTDSRLGKPYSAATREQVRKLIARLYNWARRQGRHIGPNPANELLIKVDNERDMKLSLAQCGRLLEVCDIKEYGEKWPEASAITKIAILTGRRRGEICEMEWQNIDWEINLYKAQNTKSGDDIVLTMPDDVRELLLSIGPQDEGEIFLNSQGQNYYHSLDARWQEIKVKAELPADLRFHDLRHSFASAYASSGEGDIHRLKELLGHKTLDMTLRYVHLFDEARQRDANVVADQIKAAIASDESEYRIEKDFEGNVARIKAMKVTEQKKSALIAKAELVRDMELAEKAS